MTGRAVPEWIGKTPDSAIPPRVRLRVFNAHGGICHLSKRKISAGQSWDCDHIVALINGGEHRESNLAPAIREVHREKTAEDMAIKSKTYRMAAKHNGTFPRSRSRLPSRPFPSSRGTHDGSF